MMAEFDSRMFKQLKEKTVLIGKQSVYLGHWLDMVYLPPQGEFCRPYFS